jgi:hypothetical protein
MAKRIYPRSAWIRTGRRAGGRIVNQRRASLMLGLPVEKVLELVPRHVPGKDGHIWMLEAHVLRLLPPEERPKKPLLMALYAEPVTPQEPTVDPPSEPHVDRPAEEP